MKKVLSFKILKLARVAESEDAQDLKSWAPKGAWGFESLPGHLKPIKFYFFVFIIGIIIGAILDWAINKYFPPHPASEFLTHKIKFGIENVKVDLVALNFSLSLMFSFSLIMLIFGLIFVILYKQLWNSQNYLKVIKLRILKIS